MKALEGGKGMMSALREPQCDINFKPQRILNLMAWPHLFRGWGFLFSQRSIAAVISSLSFGALDHQEMDTNSVMEMSKANAPMSIL